MELVEMEKEKLVMFPKKNLLKNKSQNQKLYIPISLMHIHKMIIMHKDPSLLKTLGELARKDPKTCGS